MTKQNIFLGKSTNDIKNAFITHFKNSISSSTLLKKNYELDYLHLGLSNKNLLVKGTDQSTLFHKAIYSTFDKSNYLSTEFHRKYRELCLEVLEKIKKISEFYGEWAIQRFPTVRFHFPNNVSVFEFHRDSDYSHPLGEINCFYAINECLNSSALQIEKNLGFEDYCPLNLNPGEYAILNTSIFKHGDVLNKTKKTRISMDFRFIPNYLLNKENVSLTKGIKFSSDSYFVLDKEI